MRRPPPAFLALCAVLLSAPLPAMLAGNNRLYAVLGAGIVALSGLALALVLFRDARKAEARESFHERALDNFFRSSREGLFEASLDGRLRRVNETLSRLLRRPSQELLGKSIWEFLEGKTPAAAAKLIRGDAGGAAMEVLRVSDGQDREPYALELLLESDALDNRFLQGMMRPVDKPNYIEEMRKNITLNVCRTIQLGLEKMGERALAMPPEQSARFRRSMDDAFDSLAGVLMHPEFEGYRPPIHREPVDLVPLFHRLLAEMGAVARLRGQYIENHIEGPELRAEADTEALYAALRNLVSNALRVTPAGRNIRLEARERMGEILCVILDGGAGLCPADLSVITRPFRVGDGAEDRFIHGLGLGLWLARAYVESHNGRLEFKNRPDGGTEVTARFPQTAAKPKDEASRD